MRVAVDARELAARPTGVGRYLSELLVSWSRDPRAQTTHVTLISPHPLDLPPGLVGESGARIETAVAVGGAGTRWEQLTLPRALGGGYDVLFCPGYSAPLLAPIPFVVAIHDVSFSAHPEWFARREGARRRWTAWFAGRRAARVITISAFSRDEIVRLLGVPADRVVVTWLAPWRTGQPDGVRAADADRRSPMVLHVGTLLNRRQLPLLVRAFAPIVRRLPQARLVIVGENRTFPFEDPVALASELGIAEAVEVRAYVSDEELTRLYAEAAAFAFLSTYEGFGLTPLEAMAAGVPVVACDTAVAREVYGDAVLLVPPGDEAGVTTALTRLLEDDELRARLRAAASLTLGRLSWDTTARATLDVLEQAART